VVGTVNGREVSASQLDFMLQRQNPPAGVQPAEFTRRLLDGLIDEELAADAARKAGLDQDPRVVQGMEAAKREILARAYQEGLAQKAPLVSTEEIERYYNDQPALFAQRRLYSLKELGIHGTPEQMLALKPRIEAATGAQQVIEILNVANVAFTERDVSVSPEDVPLPLLERLGGLAEGRSLVLPQPNGGRVLTVLSARPSPVGRDSARKPIEAYLGNEHKRQYIADAMAAMRSAAKIEYKGAFAVAAASAPFSAASQPPIQ